jgi:hypothetical protein
MRKILRNHFGNASKNGLCLSGKCGVVIFDKFVFKQCEGGWGGCGIYDCPPPLLCWLSFKQCEGGCGITRICHL